MRSVCIFMLLFLVSCSGGLDIKQNYDFNVKTLPVPKKLREGESAVIEFTIMRSGYYTDVVFSFRYFQMDGQGTLYNSNGDQFTMNRYYEVRDHFKLIYVSHCSELQTLDFVFTDNFGKEVPFSISFQPDNSN